VVGPVDELTDGTPCGVLHRDPLQLGAPPECNLLVLGEAECHRYDGHGINSTPPASWFLSTGSRPPVGTPGSPVRSA